MFLFSTSETKMNLLEYRSRCQEAHRNGWNADLNEVARALSRGTRSGLRGMDMLGWYDSTLVCGPDILGPVYELVSQALDEECAQELEPRMITPGEISLAGHANLFSCCGHPDHTHRFKHRLSLVRTTRNGPFPAWHHGKLLAAVALGEPKVYRGPLGVDVAFDQPIPFCPGELHGYNPQSLLRHLAAGTENGASIFDVWPAFRECVLNFPVKGDSGGDFDGSCLFWIARIVHHHIGRQPLGETAAWLHRHFNAWAEGNDLPPLGALGAV
jgi:hypothetical protein